MVQVQVYLASEDDDFIDRSGSLVLQELVDDEVSYGAGANDSKVLVT